MDDTGQSCAECLESVSTAVHAQNGASLCPQCAEQFYCTCAGCGGLISQDEAVVRDGALCCAQCLTAPISNDDAATLSDEALAALVAEFIRLHAEAKQLNERLDTIKEELKRHAASQPRIANTVMLRTGEYAVKSPAAPSKRLGPGQPPRPCPSAPAPLPLCVSPRTWLCAHGAGRILPPPGRSRGLSPSPRLCV